MKRLLFLTLILVFSLSAKAQTAYRTAELQRLAKVLAIDGTVFHEGFNDVVAGQRKVVVGVSNNTVNHIGLHLFSDEMRQSVHTPVLQFLERYFLQLNYPPRPTSANNMIHDDQFRFLTGNLQTVDDLLPTDAFSFNYDKRLYTVSWKRNGQPILEVCFPVEYELISGENKIEAENNLMADIQQTVVTGEAPRTALNQYYLNDQFSSRLYEQKGTLVFSERHPAESVANMLLSQQTKGAFVLQMTQVSYGFQKTTFSVPLRQWIAFCQNNGCQLYVGIEDIKDSGEISAVVLAVNEAENYNHVLTVTVPPEAIREKTGTIEARIWPYVPTHNVQNLFDTYRKSNPKTFVSK